MKELKIINRSVKPIKLAECFHGAQRGGTYTIAPDGIYKYAMQGESVYKSIRLDLPHEDDTQKPYMFLNWDFMKANKIAYVRKGDGERWFVDPIHRTAKLVRKCVCNSTTSAISVAEFVSEREETKRVPGKTEIGNWTAWWETTVASRSKDWLIVDPVAVEKKERRYFGREGGGPPLLGSIAQVNMLRQQNNNVNGDIHEILTKKHDEHMDVKESAGGMLDWTSSRRPWFWSKPGNFN